MIPPVKLSDTIEEVAPPTVEELQEQLRWAKRRALHAERQLAALRGVEPKVIAQEWIKHKRSQRG